MKAQQKLFTAIILLYSAFSFAQTDSLDFKDGVFLPEKKYTLENIINTRISKVYSGNTLADSTKKEIALQAVITTGKISQKDSIFPISMKYLRNNVYPFLQNIEIKGYGKPLKTTTFTEVSAPSMKLSQEESDGIIKQMSDFLNAAKLPSKKIKIGDSLSITSTLDFPAGGHLKIDSDFVLKEIKEGKAYFDVTRTQKLENPTISGGEKASGTAVYDIANYTFLSINIEGNLIFINKNNQSVVKINSTESQTVTVEDNTK